MIYEVIQNAVIGLCALIKITAQSPSIRGNYEAIQNAV